MNTYENGTLYIFDADNTLRVCTVPGQHYPRTFEDQRPIEWMRERLAAIDWSANLIGVATNQAGVAKGEFDSTKAAWMVRDALTSIVGQYADERAEIRVCPHRTAFGCACKKPSPWMLLDIARVCHTPLERVIYVGDMDIDAQAAHSAGVRFEWAWDFCGRSRDEWQTMLQSAKS